MKAAKITYLVLVIILAGCEPATLFDEPQPTGAKTLNAIPKRVHGNYQSQDGASVLRVSSRSITRHYNFLEKLDPGSVEKHFEIRGDSLYDKETGQAQKLVRGQEDTVIVNTRWTDTLFAIGKQGVIKKAKGYLFLSKVYEDKGWEVKMLMLKDGILTLGDINLAEYIEKLKAITETATDTIPKPIHLSRRQFRQFVKDDGFRNRESFSRMPSLK